MMTIKTVGLIGVGLMGHGIGKNIVEKGFALNVMAHRNREPVDDLVKRGACRNSQGVRTGYSLRYGHAANRRSCLWSRWNFVRRAQGLDHR
jgi:6-phosphogluconate dehydrogenase (decarboxylating)